MNKPFECLKLLVKCLIYLTLVGSTVSCKKLVEIHSPTSSIVSSTVFSSDDVALQSVAGLYFFMANNSNLTFSRGGITIYSGLSSDELVLYNQFNTVALEFNQNNILPNNVQLYQLLWQPPYSTIYHANAILEGLRNSEAVSDSVKAELTAEVKLIRAFTYFYLINLFGNVPYPESSDWRKNSLLSRLSSDEVYQNLLSDLMAAQSVLPPDYSVGKGQRIIPNKFAATAMLARIYLYLKNWRKAEIEATQIINSSLFSLNSNLNDIFKPNSTEAIWQLQQDNTNFSFNGTGEGTALVPRTIPVTAGPFAYLTNSLLNSFDISDNRKAAWINGKVINGLTFYYPYKYKLGFSEVTANGSFTEYYMILRLAEQFLIRAEARAKQNKLTDAISDINVIRQRAGLLSLSNTLTQQEIIDAIEQERRIEFFCEWGHRWLDLKRWDKAGIILQPIKGDDWQVTDQLYPIPSNELTTGPNLIQNTGYD